MSWSDTALPRKALIVLAAMAGIAAAGCTVQPLYYAGPVTLASVAPGLSARLASIAISDTVTRPGQEVRNYLIIMFGGGRGEPANPAYRMQLNVTTRVIGAQVVQIGTTASEPTSSIVTVTANYRIIETATGREVAAGSRSTNSAFDYPRQLYAAARAQRDAENRAARETAEMVRLAVAQQMARLP